MAIVLHMIPTRKKPSNPLTAAQKNRKIAELRKKLAEENRAILQAVIKGIPKGAEVR